MNKPAVVLFVYDENDNEITEQIEINTETLAQAIELWQYLRQQADHWKVKNV